MSRSAQSEKGSVAVEFAILLPLFIMFVWGAIEFGMAYYTQEVITNAAREGARAGIVQVAPKLSASDIQTIVTNYVTNSGIPVGPLGAPVVTNAMGAFQTPLTVTASYTYNFPILTMITAGVVPSSITLRATTVMRHE